MPPRPPALTETRELTRAVDAISIAANEVHRQRGITFDEWLDTPEGGRWINDVHTNAAAVFKSLAKRSTKKRGKKPADTPTP